MLRSRARRPGSSSTSRGLTREVEGRRVKFSGGEPHRISGPFAGPKELTAGYWILQVTSMDAAVDWVRRVPFEARARIYPGEYGAEGEIR